MHVLPNDLAQMMHRSAAHVACHRRRKHEAARLEKRPRTLDNSGWCCWRCCIPPPEATAADASPPRGRCNHPQCPSINQWRWRPISIGGQFSSLGAEFLHWFPPPPSREFILGRSIPPRSTIILCPRAFGILCSTIILCPRAFVVILCGNPPLCAILPAPPPPSRTLDFPRRSLVGTTAAPASFFDRLRVTVPSAAVCCFLGELVLVDPSICAFHAAPKTGTKNSLVSLPVESAPANGGTFCSGPFRCCGAVGGPIIGSAMSMNQPNKGNITMTISMELCFCGDFMIFCMERLHRIL